jgi:hypothetical protein
MLATMSRAISRCLRENDAVHKRMQGEMETSGQLSAGTFAGSGGPS